MNHGDYHSVPGQAGYEKRVGAIGVVQCHVSGEDAVLEHFLGSVSSVLSPQRALNLCVGVCVWGGLVGSSTVAVTYVCVRECVNASLPQLMDMYCIGLYWMHCVALHCDSMRWSAIVRLFGTSCVPATAWACGRNDHHQWLLPLLYNE